MFRKAWGAVTGRTSPSEQQQQPQMQPRQPPQIGARTSSNQAVAGARGRAMSAAVGSSVSPPLPPVTCAVGPARPSYQQGISSGIRPPHRGTAPVASNANRPPVSNTSAAATVATATSTAASDGRGPAVKSASSHVQNVIASNKEPRADGRARFEIVSVATPPHVVLSGSGTSGEKQAARDAPFRALESIQQLSSGPPVYQPPASDRPPHAAALAPELMAWINSDDRTVKDVSETGNNAAGDRRKSNGNRRRSRRGRRSSIRGAGLPFTASSSAAAAAGVPPVPPIPQGLVNRNPSNKSAVMPGAGLFAVKVTSIKQTGVAKETTVQATLSVGKQQYRSPQLITKQAQAGQFAASHDGTYVFDVTGTRFTLRLTLHSIHAQQAQDHQSSLSLPKPGFAQSASGSLSRMGFKLFNSFGKRPNAAIPSSTASAATTTQLLGELFLDFPLQKRARDTRTYTLPPPTVEAMRSKSRGEITVTVEFGVIIEDPLKAEQDEAAAAEHERERVRIQAEENAREAARLAEEAKERSDRQRAERTVFVQRGHLTIFTRSGQLSTWKRYWAVLDTRALHLYDAYAKETKQVIASIPLIHLESVTTPVSDLVTIGPTGVELVLTPLAMTDRHRRQSAFPRQTQYKRQAAAAAAVSHGDGSISLKAARLAYMAEWQCRIYIMAEPPDSSAMSDDGAASDDDSSQAEDVSEATALEKEIRTAKEKWMAAFQKDEKMPAVSEDDEEFASDIDMSDLSDSEFDNSDEDDEFTSFSDDDDEDDDGAVIRDDAQRQTVGSGSLQPTVEESEADDFIDPLDMTTAAGRGDDGDKIEFASTPQAREGKVERRYLFVWNSHDY
ncbi:hypothetical protein GQ42DRAFT_159021 [Ramicandelaber brevisporus]|nr:hypothetical protein GQ42DRAFT_159021 [Ramicandelaber brevisporus]